MIEVHCYRRETLAAIGTRDGFYLVHKRLSLRTSVECVPFSFSRGLLVVSLPVLLKVFVMFSGPFVVGPSFAIQANVSTSLSAVPSFVCSKATDLYILFAIFACHDYTKIAYEV